MNTFTFKKAEKKSIVNQDLTLGFDNSYRRLPGHFYHKCRPTAVAAPKLIKYNEALARDLGINLADSTKPKLADLFSGNTISVDTDPIAMAYAGHQFGSFVQQLGDGRAILLGEKVGLDGNRYDIQLKGSGLTAFSRGGDGRSALGPVLREYIVSEAMHALGIPTTRALAMISSGENVFREKGATPGGILTRVASGFVRIGTFEYFLARSNYDALRQLADYCIERHYPEAQQNDSPYLGFFTLVCEQQAQLIVQWMRVGFIHGVMNTDNTAICGETIDYGPCAFMDHYDPDTVFSSIDRNGRYRFSQQSSIIIWNLTSLANCLLPLIEGNEENTVQDMKLILTSTQENLLTNWQEQMNRKLGLQAGKKEDPELVSSFLDILHQQEIDYTLAFRYLADTIQQQNKGTRFLDLFTDKEPIQLWLKQWHQRLEQETAPLEHIEALMNGTNPAFIPRNHRIDHALQRAEQEHDFTEVHKLIEILANPYEEQQDVADYMNAPRPEERIRQTFCGT